MNHFLLLAIKMSIIKLVRLFSIGSLLAAPAARTESFNGAHTTGVHTTSGSYIGHPAEGFPGVTEYLGIPYASAPVGNLRFAAPLPFNSTGTYRAANQPYDCPSVAQPWGIIPNEYWSHADRIMAQESANGYNAMSEDCLKLNVWAPSGSVHPKAVMVWIYGGGK